MEDLKKLDDEIVRLAPLVADIVAKWSVSAASYPEITNFLRAIDAKRSASRPKLLSGAQAMRIFWKKDPNAHDAYHAQVTSDMQAVLDADRASILKVIEGLPAHVQQWAASGAWILVPPRADGYDTRDRYVRLSDIRSALSTREG